VYLGLRDLTAAKGRFVLVGVVIGLIAFMAAMLAGLANGLVDDGISGLRSLPVTHLAFQKKSGGDFSHSSLTPAQLQDFTGDKGIEATPIGVSIFNAKPADGKGESIDMALFGVEGDSFLSSPSPARQEKGEDLATALDNGLVLSRDLEGKVKVGDKLTIVGTDTTLPVIGFTYAGTYGHVPIAYTSLSTWQHLLYGDGADGRFSAIAIRKGDDAALAKADTAADTETMTKEEAYNGSPGFAPETATMTLIRGFLLVISALVVGAFFTVWTIQRTRQIGLLKALGASSGYVVRDALGQLAIILAVSIGVGAAAAFGLGSLIKGAPFSLTLGTALGTAAVLGLIGMAGSLVALRRITRVDPAISLSSGA
jgi:putative ABC transport system permease protein